MTREVDVVVVGGGPGGSALATLVANAGADVALFEKQVFPRFQIGESLVPACNLTLEALGVLDRMDARGFPRKHAVQFFLPSGPTRPFYFSEVADARMHSTWQVLRSEFDAMLFEHARERGVAAEMDAEIVDVLAEGDAVVGVRVKTRDGREEEVRARVVVDAAGLRGPLARQFGDRMHLEGLENFAVYAHFEGARLDEGIDAGSTLIFRLDHDSWLWFIPLPGRVSVGLVTPAARFAERRAESLEAILRCAIAQSPELSERMTNARAVTDVRAARDFSYKAEKDGGRGWMLVGDALAFIDPIYSTGLFLALHSAEVGARAVSDALRRDNGVPDLAGYSAEYQVSLDQLLTLVRAYYSETVHFGSLARDAELRQGLVDLLTGVVGTKESVAVTDRLRASLQNGHAL